MRIFVDGNPTTVCCVLEGGRPVVKSLYWKVTSNEAEYYAVLYALYQFPNADEILSDSELIVKQLNGQYALRNRRLRELAVLVWKQAGDRVKFTWIPREENLAGKVLG